MEKSTINAVWLHKYHKAMDNECFKKIFFLSFGCKHQCGFHKFADFSDFIYSGLLHNTLYTVAWPLVSFDILQCGCLHRKPLWAREYWIKYGYSTSGDQWGPWVLMRTLHFWVSDIFTRKLKTSLRWSMIWIPKTLGMIIGGWLAK